MDNTQQPTPAEFARELFRRGLDPMRLDADVEQMVLVEFGKHFMDEVDDGVLAFAA